ncbi:MAG: ABC transporter substrate-binding protein [Ferruginibacter sp.]
MNIGILYPRSKTHSELAFDFLDGLKAFIKEQNLTNEFRLFSESVGFGGAEKEVYEKAEKLLLIESVDVLIAYIDQRVMGILTPLFFASGKLILIVNPGANYPLNWIPQKNIVNLTLQHAFLCWLSGKDAGRQTNNEAALLTTYYDCGYLHGTAIIKSFIKEKGTISFNYVNNQAYDENFHINELKDFLLANKTTTNLLCICDSLPALLVYQQLNKFERATELKFFVSPMMLEPKAIEHLKEGYHFSIEGYMPWLPVSETDANKKFTDFYRQHTKREAGIFSLLGWETGMILQQVYNDSNENFDDGAAITEQLSKIKMDSPRGELKMDPATQYFLAPVVKCVVENNAVKMKTEIIETYEKEWLAFTGEPTEGIISGWMNTYLCY